VKTPAIRYIAFLRAINVGGHVVKMDALRRQFVALGFTNVETFIASGNVVFEGPSRDRPALERAIEKRLLNAFGYEVQTFLRTCDEVAAIAGYQPFSRNAVERAGAFVVGFVADPIGAALTKKLMSLRTDVDDFHVNGREVYWLCGLKQSESTFSNAVFEKALGVRATFRGANTLKKMAARYAGAAGKIT
jgi:uncharacterized protein (DUF1697 family)